MNPTGKPVAEDLLSGWKAIAGFLDVDKSTAQRWVKSRGLPVRYLPGAKGKVVAYAAELDAWLKSGCSTAPSTTIAPGDGLVTSVAVEDTVEELSGAAEAVAVQPGTPLEPAIRRRTWLRNCAFGAVGLAVLAVARNRFGLSQRQPVSRHVDGANLTVMGEDGSALWRHTFPHQLDPEFYEPNKSVCVFADLDGDGGWQTLFKYAPLDRPSERRLICFDARGEIRWEFLPGRTVKDNLGRQFQPPFWPHAYQVVQSSRARTANVVVSSNHHYSFADQVAVLNGKTGRLLSEYWHRGHLLHMATLDLEGRGEPTVLLGGVNDALEYKQATLVAFDHRRIWGATRNPRGGLYFEGMAPGTEKCVVYFPRTPVGLTQEFNLVNEVSVGPRSITVGVVEGITAKHGPNLTYELDYSFRVINVLLSDDFLNSYAALQTAGVPKESSDALAERLKREVRVLRFNG